MNNQEYDRDMRNAETTITAPDKMQSLLVLMLIYCDMLDVLTFYSNYKTKIIDSVRVMVAENRQLRQTNEPLLITLLYF